MPSRVRGASDSNLPVPLLLEHSACLATRRSTRRASLQGSPGREGAGRGGKWRYRKGECGLTAPPPHTHTKKRTAAFREDKSLSSSKYLLLSGPPMTGQQEGCEKPKTSRNLHGALPQAIFPHPWGSRTLAPWGQSVSPAPDHGRPSLNPLAPTLARGAWETFTRRRHS